MKLIASDFDGTLSVNGCVTPENAKAVTRWQEAGNLFVLVTGRPYLFALDAWHVMQESGMHCDALICCNGAMFLDEAGDVTYKVCVDGAVLPPLVELIYRHDPTLVVFSVGGKRREYSEENGEMVYYPEKDGGKIPQFLREPHDFVQICVGLRNAEECLTIADDINRTFPGTLDAKPNGYSCDITVSGIQKPAGIHRFVETLPEKPEDVITVGDNLNDLSMLREFTGYAIEAGSPKAHSAAGRTVPSVAALIDLLLQ